MTAKTERKSKPYLLAPLLAAVVCLTALLQLNLPPERATEKDRVAPLISHSLPDRIPAMVPFLATVELSGSRPMSTTVSHSSVALGPDGAVSWDVPELGTYEIIFTVANDAGWARATWNVTVADPQEKRKKKAQRKKRRVVKVASIKMPPQSVPRYTMPEQAKVADPRVKEQRVEREMAMAADKAMEQERSAQETSRKIQVQMLKDRRDAAQRLANEKRRLESERRRIERERERLAVIERKARLEVEKRQEREQFIRKQRRLTEARQRQEGERRKQMQSLREGQEEKARLNAEKHRLESERLRREQVNRLEELGHAARAAALRRQLEARRHQEDDIKRVRQDLLSTSMLPRSETSKRRRTELIKHGRAVDFSVYHCVLANDDFRAFMEIARRVEIEVLFLDMDGARVNQKKRPFNIVRSDRHGAPVTVATDFATIADRLADRYSKFMRVAAVPSGASWSGMDRDLRKRLGVSGNYQMIAFVPNDLIALIEETAMDYYRTNRIDKDLIFHKGAGEIYFSIDQSTGRIVILEMGNTR